MVHTTKNKQVIFLKKNRRFFTLGKFAEMSNLETVCSMNRWMIRAAVAWVGIANYNFSERDIRKLFPAIFLFQSSFLFVGSHLRHVEVNCTWQSVYSQTRYTHLSLIIVLIKVNSSTLNRVSTVAFTVSVLWRDFCEIISKKCHKFRVDKYFAGFLSWYFEEI